MSHRKMGQLPEVDDTSYDFFSDEEIENIEFLDDGAPLNAEGKKRLEELLDLFNGTLPPQTNIDKQYLPAVVGRMSAKAILRYNDCLPRGTIVDAHPHSIIGLSRSDEYGDRSIVYLGRNYIGAMSIMDFYGWILDNIANSEARTDEWLHANILMHELKRYVRPEDIYASSK